MNTDKFTYAGIKTAKYDEDSRLVYLLPKQNQDYAICGEDRIIICDGCSSSPDTDLGAGLLSLSASIADLYIGSDENISTRCDRIGKRIIDHTWNNKAGCIAHTAFDATLLIASHYKNKVSVLIYGDGYIVYKNKIGIIIHQIYNTHNAPAYLSYYLDDSRKSSYIALDSRNYLITTQIFNNGETRGSNTCLGLDVFAPTTFTFNVQEEDEIYLLTDGVGTFRYETGEKKDEFMNPIDLIINEFTNIKNTKGKFLQRRCNRLIKNLFKQDIHPIDDVTIAGIII